MNKFESGPEKRKPLSVPDEKQQELKFDIEQSKDVSDTIETEGLVAKGEKSEPNIQETIKDESLALVTKDNERENPGWDDWGKYNKFRGKMNLYPKIKRVKTQEEKNIAKMEAIAKIVKNRRAGEDRVEYKDPLDPEL